MIRHSLLVVVMLTGVASAQPGATPPTEAPPAPTEAPPAPTEAPPPLEAAPPVEAPPASESPPGQASDQASEGIVDAAIARAEAAAPSLETFVRGTFRRARRSISIGPTVGLWTGAFINQTDIDAALTFGIGVETFKVPVVPSVATLRALIQERVKAQLKERIKDAFQGRAVDPLQVDTLAAQVYADVRDEILGVRNVRGKTIERPRFTVGFEANRLFSNGWWLGRTRVGIGVSKFTFALSAAVGRVCSGENCEVSVRGFIGPEVVLHLLTSKGPRASVVDVFLRFDYQVNGRGNGQYDQAILGARYLLDIF
jgi:hypothetical protein